ERLPEKIRTVRRALERFCALEHVGEVRQCGLMVGIELVRDRATLEPYAWEEAMGVRVCAAARELGLLTRPLKDVIVFLPPLCSTHAELEEMVEIIYQAVELETGRFPGPAGESG